jgi:methionyl-tRNA formyltransferase
MVATLRVAFFGTPQFAVPSLEALLASRHTVCGVVTQPDRPRGRGQHVTDGPVKALAASHGLPLLQPASLADSGVESTLRSWAPDIGVVVAYGQLVPDALLALPRLGLINVHPSLLPKYRGAAPVHRAIIAGETVTGVCIMRVTPRLDAGAVFASIARPIGPRETSDVVEADLSRSGARLLVEVVDRLADGTWTETPQDDSQATYARKLTKAEAALDWTQPAGALHNRIRGLQPWPHASTHLGGTRLIVLESEPAEGGPHSLPPGTIARADPDALHVAAGNGTVLALLAVQLEGRRPMRIREFMAGHAPRAGQRFTSP